MDFKKALNKCMYTCSKREYCVIDIKKKLIKWEVSESDQIKIINNLIKEKYIDENRYVLAFVNDKFAFNHWGKIKIKYHLKQKRIDKEIINKYIDKINHSDYEQTILEEIKKKKKTVTGKNEFEKNQKVARFVISKGFEPQKVFDFLQID